MNEPIILDTNAILAFFRGEETIEELMMGASKVMIPAICHGEYLAGCERGGKSAARERDLYTNLLAVPTVKVIPVSSAIAEYYAKVYAYLSRVGAPIPTNDIWIAATALATGAELITRDRHLLSIPLIRASAW